MTPAHFLAGGVRVAIMAANGLSIMKTKLQGMDAYEMLIDGKKHVIPYRFNSSITHTLSDETSLICRRSKDSDGYKREAALRGLVSRDLDALAAAYVLVALGDYALPINALPREVTTKTRTEMRKVVEANPRFVQYLDAVTISYWNEYYRGLYSRY